MNDTLQMGDLTKYQDGFRTAASNFLLNHDIDLMRRCYVESQRDHETDFGKGVLDAMKAWDALGVKR